MGNIEEQRDWRVGLTVRMRNANVQGQVVEVMPSGHAGIFDSDGVLKVKTSDGITITGAASLFVSAVRRSEADASTALLRMETLLEWEKQQEWLRDQYASKE